MTRLIGRPQKRAGGLVTVKVEVTLHEAIYDRLKRAAREDGLTLAELIPRVAQDALAWFRCDDFPPA